MKAALAGCGPEGVVVRVDARHEGTWDLPVIGEVEAPPAVLVRPDGHVAWVGGLADTGLRDVLTTWFGPGRPR